MKAVGRNPSASGAKDDSSWFQRWVGGKKEPSPPGTAQDFVLAFARYRGVVVHQLGAMMAA